MTLKSALEDLSRTTLEAVVGCLRKLEYLAGLHEPKGGEAVVDQRARAIEEVLAGSGRRRGRRKSEALVSFTAAAAARSLARTSGCSGSSPSKLWAIS